MITLLEYYTDEIINGLKPYDIEHNEKHVKEVLSHVLPGNKIDPEKLEKFQQYKEELAKHRLLESPNTPIHSNGYIINVLPDHAGNLPDLFPAEKTPILLDLFDGAKAICISIKKWFIKQRDEYKDEPNSSNP